MLHTLNAQPVQRPGGTVLNKTSVKRNRFFLH